MKRNKFIKAFNIITLLAVIFVSCNDDDGGKDGFDIDTFPELNRGGFARFPDGQFPPSTVSFAVPAEASFSIPIEDYNDNITSYSLTVTGNIGGQTFIAEDYLTITSFPNQLNISVPEIATTLGLDLEQVNFSDTFEFIATVVTNDGNVFVGLEPTYDTETGVIGLGNTEGQLLTNPNSYNSAMAFGFTLACPEFEIVELEGTYNVTLNALASGLGLSDPNPIREVIAGPGENQITIVGGSVGFVGGEDLVVDVDTSTGVLSLGLNEDGEPGLAFPVGAGGLGFSSNYAAFNGDGLAISCIDNPTLNMPVTLSCCGGTWTLVLEKQ